MNYLVKDGYNKVANKYADAFYNELDTKPIDRHLLKEYSIRIRKGSRVCDLGCGPGHISRYVKGLGLDVFGLELSEGMLRTARERNSDIEFIKGDMTDLKFVEECLGGVILYYSIVHFSYEEVEKVFIDLWKMLEDNGLIFLAFHEGNHVLHVDSFFDENVDLDYMFFDTDKIVEILTRNKFKIVEVLTRYPYTNYEYNSKKGYIICEKIRE